MTRILSIDWDWITGDCCHAKGMHAHCGWCSQFKTTGGYGERQRRRGRGSDEHVDPERFETHGEATVVMLKRVMHNKPKVYVSECHADIVRLLKPGDTVWTFDAHDDGADCGSLCCGSWELTAAMLNVEVHSMAADLRVLVLDAYAYQDWLNGSARRYTSTKRKAGDPHSALHFRHKVDVVFLCRSSPFTPRERDPDFYALCHSLAKRAPLEFFGYRAEELRREAQL